MHPSPAAPQLLPAQGARQDARDLAAALDRLACEARELSASLAAGSAGLSAEQELERRSCGLGGDPVTSVLAPLVPGSRLVALRPDRDADVLAVHRSLTDRVGTVVAVVGDVVLALVHSRRRRAGGDAALVAARELCRGADARWGCRSAVSTPLCSVEDVAAAARDVRDLLALQGSDRHAVVDDSWAQLLTSRAAGALEQLLPYRTPLAALADLPPSPFGNTLLVWLRHDGDVHATSSTLGVHVNTLRYRLRRVEELTGLDLRDTCQRIALQLWALSQPAPASPRLVACQD